MLHFHIKLFLLLECPHCSVSSGDNRLQMSQSCCTVFMSDVETGRVAQVFLNECDLEHPQREGTAEGDIKVRCSVV